MDIKERGIAEAFGEVLAQKEIEISEWKNKYECLLKEFDELKLGYEEYKESWSDLREEHEKLLKHVTWIRSQL